MFRNGCLINTEKNYVRFKQDILARILPTRKVRTLVSDPNFGLEQDLIGQAIINDYRA